MDAARIFRDAGGFTLLEAMVAVTVLSLAIFGITAPFAIGAAGQAEDARQTLANALAQEMMEEILAKPHDTADDEAVPGLPPAASGKRRVEFVRVEEYAVVDEPPGRIEDLGGHAIRDPAVTGLSRHTRVHYVRVGGQMSSRAPFLRVDVEIRHKGHHLLTLSRLVYCTPRED